MNKSPIVFIRAVIVLAFAAVLSVSASVSATLPNPGNSRASVSNGTAFSGAIYSVNYALADAKKASVEETQTNTVAAAFDGFDEATESTAEGVQEPSLEDNSDVILLARLIQAEGGSLTENEQVAIALTVLYRTDMPAWPDTISGNVYKTNQYAEPASTYSDQALQSAIKAYTLWSEGRGSEVLPEGYYSFFGNGSHNYFYNKNLEIYNLAGVPMPSDIYDQMTQIIPALRRAAEGEAEESTEVAQSVEDEAVQNPDASSEELAQSEITTNFEEQNGVSENTQTESEVAEFTTLSTGDESLETANTIAETGEGEENIDSVECPLALVERPEL